MPITNEGKTLYLNGGDVAPVKIVPHTAEPNATGTTNRIGALQACAFAVSVGGGARAMSADVSVAIPAATTTASHFSIYNASDVCLFIEPFNTARTGLVEGDTLVLQSSGVDAISISIT